MKKKNNLDSWYRWYMFKQIVGSILILLTWLTCVIGVPVTIVWICAKFIFHII